MVSSTNFADSLTITNASSGHYTLTVMSIFALILLPVILLYQAWSYHVFRARLGHAEPGREPDRPAGGAEERRPGRATPDLGSRPAVDSLSCERSIRASSVVRAPRVLRSSPTRSSGSWRRCSCSPRRCCSRASRRDRSTAPRSRTSRRRWCCSSSSSSHARVATWGFEAVGTRAATGVLSQLRLDLVTARLKGDPTALDGAESAEVATAAVAGVDALEGLFGRYLPQLVLAVVVPVAVLVARRVARPRLGRADAADAAARPGLLLADRPCDRQPRARALAGDVAARDPLPRRRPRAADAARLQPRRGPGRADRAGRATSTARRRWARCGSRFSPGTVLELAATLGVALVAVTVGVRLVDGGIAFEPALTVLVLAPELYLPLRNLAAGFHASADGAAVADRLLDVDRAAVPLPPGAADPPSLREAPIRFESVSFAYPEPAGRGARRGRPRARARRDASRSSGRAAAARARWRRCCCASTSPRAAGSWSATSTSPTATRPPGAAQIAWVPQSPTLFRGTVADNIRLGDPTASDERRARGGSARRRGLGRRAPAGRLRHGRRRGRAGRCRPESASASRSPAPSSATRRSSCSTSRRRTSIRRAHGSSARRSSGCGPDARCC